MRTAKTLIRLGGCPGWSESSMGAQSLCWFCHVVAHFHCVLIKPVYFLVITNPRYCSTMEPRHDKTNKVSVRPAKTQISLGIRPVWSESSLYVQWVGKDPRFLHADSEDWSDWADAQTDLSLRWAHTHFVGFVMSRLNGLQSVILPLITTF